MYVIEKSFDLFRRFARPSINRGFTVECGFIQHVLGLLATFRRFLFESPAQGLLLQVIAPGKL